MTAADTGSGRGPRCDELARAVADQAPPPELLLRSDVLVPVAGEPPADKQMVTIASDAGDIALIVFTTPAAFVRWRGGPGAVVPGATVLDAALSVSAAAVVIDIDGPAAAAVSVRVLAEAARTAGSASPVAREVAIGAPMVAPPPEAVAAVREAARRVAGVRAGYLFQMAGDGRPPHLVAGLELSAAGDHEATMRAAVDVIGAVMPPGHGLDVMALRDDLLRTVQSDVPALA